ncbi:MAG: glycosyltransferase family 4 protein [Alphaproteobacteria bacterium]|nr:glycosyltransferase family 4 protein [Alphaproteobacteria bacterium]
MKILYLHPRAWTGEYSMLQALRALGHDVCVLEEQRDDARGAWHVTPGFLSDDDGFRTQWFDPRRGAVKLLTWPVDRWYRRDFDGRNLAHRMWVIRRACREFRPDVMIAADGFSYAIPAALLRRLRWVDVPLVVNYIGGDIMDCPEGDYGKRRTPKTDFLIKQSVLGTDRLRPFSPLLADILLADGANPAHVRVIQGHMPVDLTRLERFAAGRDEIGRRVRARYGIAAEAPLVVTLSVNGRGKGMHDLADAWPRILARHPQARWLLCGPVSDWIEQQVVPRLKAAGVADSVVLTGKLAGDDVFEHLAAGHLYVMPTLADGGPMSNIEAASVGTPVLTTHQAGNAPWLAEAGCGEAVPPSAPDRLVERINALLDDLPALAAMGRGGPVMARKFTAEAVARPLADLLAAACAK